MIIDLIKLKSGIIDQIDIDQDLEVEEKYLDNTEIIDMKKLHIIGYITKEDGDDYNLKVRVYGTMILPCSVSLKPTDYDFDFEIDDNIIELLEEIGKNVKKDEFTLDIFPIIWENILMEIPMRIVNSDIQDVKLKGDGWRVVTDDKKESDESVNPELAKLKDLLK